MSFWEQVFEAELKSAKIGGWEREVHFRVPGHRNPFRFDFAWPEEKVAVEIDGGTWSGGRHTRGAGYERDCEKFNAAVVEGWRVLRFTSAQVERGSAIPLLKKLLAYPSSRT